MEQEYVYFPKNKSVFGFSFEQLN